MKIRIKGNSLRYRLTRSDVDSLIQTGYLEDHVDFPGNKLVYALSLTEDEQLECQFKANTISLFMPKSMLQELANTNKVGFNHMAGDVFLLVEKDFTCLDNVEEDQSDNYPNPLAEKLYEQGN